MLVGCLPAPSAATIILVALLRLRLDTRALWRLGSKRYLRVVGDWRVRLGRKSEQVPPLAGAEAARDASRAASDVRVAHRFVDRIAEARAGLGRFFINRDYTLFMIGAFVSATGSWAQSVAIGWLVLDLGNSTFLLGVTSFAQMAPLLLFGFPAGAIIDRFDRRTCLLIAQVGAMASMTILAVTAATGRITIPLILVLAVIGGLFNALLWPTWSVFIKDLVGPEHLRAAIALNTARFNLTRVIGPAIAGVVMASYGAAACLGLAAVSALGVIFAILAIKPRPFVPGPTRPWLRSLGEALAYAYHEPRVRELLLLTSAIGLLAMPYQAFLPAIARDSLGVGPEGLGLLLTAVGCGALVGAVLSGSARAARGPERFMAACAVIAGISLIGVAAARSLQLAMIALAVVGFSSIGYLAVANATLQLAVRDDIAGRIMGLWTVVTAGVTPVGSLVIGAGAESFGLAAALASAGVGCAALGVLAAWRERANRLSWAAGTRSPVGRGLAVGVYTQDEEPLAPHSAAHGGPDSDKA